MDDIALERLQRQRPVAHGHDEGVVDELLPNALYIGPLEEVLEEVSPVFLLAAAITARMFED